MLFYYAIVRIDVEDVSVFNYIAPVFGILGSIIILAEKPELSFWIGAILIGLGLYVAESTGYHEYKLSDVHLGHHR